MPDHHKPFILNWFKTKGEISSSTVEGINLKAKLTMRKSCGFRTIKYFEIILYHLSGTLAEPENYHSFC